MRNKEREEKADGGLTADKNKIRKKVGRVTFCE